jgi:hypothetical protein
MHNRMFGVMKRRQPDLHRRIAVLQTAALLLGYTAQAIGLPIAVDG